jgi:hypothetical protein
MFIKFKATGETSHVENAQARAFIAAGLAEPVADKHAAGAGPKPDMTPKWSVVLWDNRILAIKMTREMGTAKKETHHYMGKPEFANARREWRDGDQVNGRYLYFPFAVPEKVLAEYTKQYEKNFDQTLAFAEARGEGIYTVGVSVGGHNQGYAGDDGTPPAPPARDGQGKLYGDHPRRG